jgi:beta-lactamase regulating signal transducer with metallopeptidase domain/thiol-disulfide isomerase/thioredoxin/protocatechuate 3,4-dioxygenase beta subunit
VCGAYLIGVVLMLARLLLAVRGGWALRRHSVLLDDPALIEHVRRRCEQIGLRVAPRIALCGRIAVPVVVGILRPMILVPASLLSGMSPLQIEAILAHELAHLRRRDHVVQLLQRLIESLLFFHPAVWFVSKRIHDERENCCDDIAAAQGSAVEYARALIRAAEVCLGDSNTVAPALSLAAVERRSSLRDRVLRLVNGRSTPHVRVKRVWTTLAIVALLLTTAIWRVRAADTQTKKEFTATLVDSADRPISNAYIAPEYDNLWYGVRSDREGKFTLKDLKPEQKHGVAWSQRSRKMALFSLSDAQPKIAMTLNEAEADGRVVDASGNPVAGAFVRLFVVAPDGETYRFRTWAETDKSGYYNTDNIASGEGYKIFATTSDDPKDQNRSGTLELTGQFQIEMPDIVIHTTTAPSPKPGPERVRYSGRVVDEQGKPISGVEIALSYPKNHMIAGAGTVVTDEDGKFSRLLPPDAERVNMLLMHPDFIGFHFTDATEPAVSALRDGTAVITMKRGMSISGTVVDDAGQPISNTLVALGRHYSSTPGPENELIEDGTSARTNSDGTFKIGGLPAGDRSVYVVADGYAPTTVNADVQPDLSPLRIKLSRGASYSAQVVDSDGKGLAGSHVGCNSWTTPDGQRHELSRFTYCDDHGRFTLDGLPTVGTLSFYANKRGGDFMSKSFPWSAGAKDNREKIILWHPPVVAGQVVDDATGKPVEQFDVEPGWYWQAGKPFERSTFDDVEHVKSADGKFRIKIERISMGEKSLEFAARIVAKGYLPQISPSVVAGKSNEPFVIRLKRGQGIEGVVHEANGQPAKGATVYFVNDKDDVQVTPTLKINEDFSYAPRTSTKTDADGKFEFPPQEKPGRVLVLHSAGYAIVESPTVKANDPIELIAWARLEGSVTSGGKPLSVPLVLMSTDPRRNLDARKEINFDLSTTSRPDGKFVIEHVPAKALVLTQNKQTGLSGGVCIDPKPGQTITLNFGENRRAATGRIELGAIPQKVDVQWTRARAYRIDPPIETPPGWTNASEWSSLLAAMKSEMPGFDSPLEAFGHAAVVQPDGAISFDDLEPGHYVLHTEVHAPPVPNVCGWGTILAHGRMEFDVPATSDGTTLSLPTMTLELNQHPGVGQPAPEISEKTFDGGSFKLSEQRGKLVLIDFWASWCGPCIAEMPSLKSVYEKHKTDARFVMLGGNMDWDRAAADAAITDNKITWKQLAIGNLAFDVPVCKAYGISAVPSIWLIGPDGNVIAKDLRGDAVGQAVEKALASMK